MAIAKEQLRQIIRENNLKSEGDVYALLKDSFNDLLQELLAAELDVSLGYDKNEKHGIETGNKRNGHTQPCSLCSSWCYTERKQENAIIRQKIYLTYVKMAIFVFQYT